MTDLEQARPSHTILTDAFARVHELVGTVTEDIGHDELSYRVDADANTIAWLLWHLTRVQDTHVCDLSGDEPLWQQDGWVDRFALTLDAQDTGYGASTAEVGALDDATAALLRGYHEAVDASTSAYLGRLDSEELNRVVDDSYDPPVTVATRLVSVIGDCLAHLGQAQYVRGLAERAGF